MPANSNNNLGTDPSLLDSPAVLIPASDLDQPLANSPSASSNSPLPPPPPNERPSWGFTSQQGEYTLSDTLVLEGWVEDFDGFADIDRIDLEGVINGYHRIFDFGQVTQFVADPSNPNRATFSYNIDLKNLSVDEGYYNLSVEGIAYDRSGYGLANGIGFNLTNFRPNLNFHFSQQEYNASDTLAFDHTRVEDGDGLEDLSHIDFQLRSMGGNEVIIDLPNVTEFISDGSPQSGTFNYSLDLKTLNLPRGNETWSLEGNIVDKAGNSDRWGGQTLFIRNNPPILNFGLEDYNYFSGETLTFSQTIVEDFDGIDNLDRIDFQLIIENGRNIQAIDLVDVTEFIPNSNAVYGTFDYELDLSTIPLPMGNYPVYLEGILYDKAGNSSLRRQNFHIHNDTPSVSFDLDRFQYSANDTLTLVNTRVHNGIDNLDRIDFRAIVNNGDRIIDVADVVNFTPNHENALDGTFAYNLDLKTLDLTPGYSYDIRLESFAYTKAGKGIPGQYLNFRINHTLPEQLNFSLDRQSYTSNDTLSITGGSIVDNDGATDIDRIDFRIRTDNGTTIDLPDVTSLTIDPDLYRATFDYSFDLSNLPIGLGIHNLTLEAIAFDGLGNGSREAIRQFQLTKNSGLTNGNLPSLDFHLNQWEYTAGDTLTLENAWVEDLDDITDLDRIDFFLQSDRGYIIDVADVTQFTSEPNSPDRATFNYSLELKNLGLDRNSDRNFTLVGIAYDKSGQGSQWRDVNFVISNSSPHFNFNIDNEVYGIGETLTLENAWVEDFDGLANLDRIDFQARVNNQFLIDLPDVTEFTSEFGSEYRGTFDYDLDLWTLGLEPGSYYNKIEIGGTLYDKSGNQTHYSQLFHLYNQIPEFDYRIGDQPYWGYAVGDIVTLEDTRVWGFKDIADIDRIDFWAMVDWKRIDLPDAIEFTLSQGNYEAAFDYSLNLADLGLDIGNHNVELQGILYNKAGYASRIYTQNFQVTNSKPLFDFSIEWTNSPFSTGDTLTLQNTWVEDGDGLSNLDRIDFVAVVNGNKIIDLPDVTQFISNSGSPYQGSFEYSFDLKTLDLDINNTYNIQLEGTILDKVGNVAYRSQQFYVSNHLPHVDFTLDRTQYGFSDTLTITEGWVYEPDYITDIDRIDMRLFVANQGYHLDIADITDITPDLGNFDRGTFNYNLDLASLGLDLGYYDLILQTTVYDKAGNGTRGMNQSFRLTNNIPSFNFNLPQGEYRPDDTITITEGWVEDPDGFTDLDRVEFALRNLSNGELFDVADVSNLVADPGNFSRGTFTHSLYLGSLNLEAGNYDLEGTVYDKQGNTSPLLKQGFAIAQPDHAPKDLRFSLDESEYTPNATILIENGWVMDEDGGEEITRVDLRLFDSGDRLVADLNDVTNFELATWDNHWAGFDTQINLNGFNLTDGIYTVSAIAYDIANQASNLFERSFTVTAPPPNAAPSRLTFSLDRSTYNATDTINLNNGWVQDSNGADTLDRIDLRIITEQGSTLDIDDISNLSPASWNREWGSFQHELNLSGLNLQTGSHKVVGIAYDRQGAASQQFERGFRLEVPQPNLDPTDLRFTLNKSTYNPTDTLTIGNGWIQDGNGANDLDRITFKIIASNGSEINLGESNNFTNVTWSQNWAAFSGSFDLSQYNLSDGNYTLIGTALDRSGGQSQSLSRSFTIQAPQANNTAPSKLQFGLSGSTFSVNDTLQITNGWVYDDDGNSDLVGIDFELVAEDGTITDLSDSFDLTPASWDATKRWSNFRHSLNLSALGLSVGRYSLRGKAYDQAGDYSNTFLRAFTIV
ncbi:hypothetical protein [Spirulina sp. 06S082]|uniref:hypothetical protein n=1 Tax=Spirulina sp. 06S082 TaxID=3110248 RepID=UPI002B1F9DAC|nr:hypothetical protein [Spirulina sp. 06S082]MEA5471735.1 hypothetical protein [Spirulina sp. 06S082]